MGMERLYTPWRLEYVKNSSRGMQHCIFCIKDESDKNREQFVLRISDNTMVMCNRYPYTSGHLLIAPREHTADFSRLKSDVVWEIMRLLQESMRIINDVYKAEGFNAGMNSGKASGAGVSDHIHFHILPRWAGDTNFMTTLSEVRVLPETVSQTYERLLPEFANLKI